MNEEHASAISAQTIAELARPLAESLGLSLWGVELALGGRSLVRVYVEDAKGVSVEQCADLSRLLGLALEVEELFVGAYVLEVSSPGLERIFFTPEQLASALGQTVELTLSAPVAAFSGRRKFRGLLAAVPEEDASSPGQFSLKVENPSRPGEYEGLLPFAFSALKKVRQIHIVPEKTLPGKAGKKKKPSAPGAACDDWRDSNEPGTEKSH